MTYKLDEHTEFWGGKHLPQYPADDGYPTPEQIKVMAEESVSRNGIHTAQTVKQSVAEFTNLPTPEEIKADVAKWASLHKVSPTIAELRKQVDAWPTSQNITKEAVKHDDGKPDWSLVPFESLEGMVKVLEFGAQKYAGWNWTTNGGFSYTRVLRSCLRHLFAYMRGEDNDPESGLSHIHHAMCNLLFISHYIGNKNKYNKDDRQLR